MKVVSELSALRTIIQSWRSRGETIAFVPTMGNLHAGHLQLVTQARSLADRVVVSIFVNPLQFGPTEDFALYPRTLEDDLNKLQTLDVDLVFTPTESVLYPDGRDDHSRVNVPTLSSQLCGVSRPLFFGGVATVVTKLLNLVQPHQAIFGQKDYQQWLVINQLVKDFNMPVEIVLAPTVREEDGLAMSSRNQYLTPSEREIAPLLFKALNNIVESIKKSTDQKNLNERVHTLCNAAIAELEKEGFRVDYLTVRNKQTLALASPADLPENFIVLGAAMLGKTRLIDNLLGSSLDK